MGLSSRSYAVFRLIFAAGAVALCPMAARAELSLAGSALFSGDEWGYRQEEYGVDLENATESAGQTLALRFIRYALREPLDGIYAFHGQELAGRIGAHVLADLWWLSASAGVQGTFDADGLVGELTVARALPVSDHTFTPRVELAREPLAPSPLPLSLGLLKHNAQVALTWRTRGVMAEAGARADFWEGDTVPARASNGARDRIEANRIATGYAYVLSESDGPFDAGLSAKLTAAEENTLLVTQLVPERRYAWYPSSAPVMAWETSAIVQLHGPIGDALETKLQLSLPLLSRETRQWDSVRMTSWGTAPYEAELSIEWHVLEHTSLELQAKLFVKPWESWDALGAGAYRHGSVRVALEQRI